MSGLLLTAGSSQMVPTLVSDKVIRPESLPGPATSRRTFAQGDVLALYAELYDNIPSRQRHTLEVAIRLVDESAKAVFSARETHDGATLQGAGNASTLAIVRQIPLNTVPPGRYLLQVEATPRGVRDAKPLTRETVVTIVSATITR